MSEKKQAIIETQAFKIALETAFKILESREILDAKNLAEQLRCSIVMANNWLSRMTKMEILLRKSVAFNDGRGIGSRKYVYARNNAVQIKYDHALQYRIFERKLRALKDQGLLWL